MAIKKLLKCFMIVLLVSVACGGELLKFRFHPCVDNKDIEVVYNQDERLWLMEYDVTIKGNFSEHTQFELIIDKAAMVVVHEKYGNNTIIVADKIYDTYYSASFRVRSRGNETIVNLTVRALRAGTIPYIRSIKTNHFEQCNSPVTGFFDSIVSSTRTRVRSCGRRVINQRELIVNGDPTKPGDWPWHVAIYRLEKSMVKYICGGTLISDKFVLTAAHCTTIQGVKVLPEILSVVLGKYNLIGDVTSQERLVHEITVHENFNKNLLDNDILLLKLRTVAVFDDYIQPVCLWNEMVTRNTQSNEIKGTVVGWGFDQTDSLSAQLMQVEMNIIPEVKCIRKKPLFYSRILNENKFCAGASNGTSPCNGDSGGGLVVFIPDSPGYSQEETGSWFIRGIVSTTVSLSNRIVCDPNYYVVFTDVSKYKTWITDHIKYDLDMNYILLK